MSKSTYGIAPAVPLTANSATPVSDHVFGLKSFEPTLSDVVLRHEVIIRPFRVASLWVCKSRSRELEVPLASMLRTASCSAGRKATEG